MKVNRLETHDRFLEFQKQGDLIGKGCEDCIKNRPEEFGSHPFYIFAHKREINIDERIALYNEDYYCSLTDPSHVRKFPDLETVPSARFIWQPRLTKPTPQENSMLFKAYPGTDNIKIIWIIPQRELWEQFTKGNLTESQIVVESIHDFKTNMDKLAAPEEDDLPEEIVDQIYLKIAQKKTKPFVRIK